MVQDAQEQDRGSQQFLDIPIAIVHQVSDTRSEENQHSLGATEGLPQPDAPSVEIRRRRSMRAEVGDERASSEKKKRTRTG